MNIGYSLIHISFCSSLISGKNILQDSNRSKEYAVIDCALDIANHNFDFRLRTAVLYEGVENHFVNIFLKDFHGAVVTDAKSDVAPPKQVVILLESFQSFIKIIAKLKPDLRGISLLNSGANFLIVFQKNPKRIKRITSILWSYYVLNVVIISLDARNNTVLHNYKPFQDNLHCQTTQPILLGFCNRTKYKSDLYPDKMRNMQGCPLYISTNKLYHPNMEQKNPLQIIKKAIVRQLRDIMNFTPIISMRDYVSVDSDRAKNWSDSLSDVLTGRSNISISTVPLGVDKTGFLDYSMPYFKVRLAWIAPPVAPGPVWWKLLWPLNGYLWLFLMAVTVFVKSLPFISQLKPVKIFCRRYFRNFDKMHSVEFRLWGMMMGQPIRLAPKRFRDFYVISLWMWFTFVLRSAYQSVLIVALRMDSVVGNFESLKEAVGEGYKFGGRAGILTHFEHDPMIKDGFEIIPEDKFNDVFQDVINGRTKFVLATSLEYAWAYCLALGKKEDACGHLITDSIMTIPLVVWMRNNSPFAKPLSVWLPRLIENGLLEREVALNPTFLVVKSSEESALTSQQTASCFLCLLLGIIMSTIVFLLEMIQNKTQRLMLRNKIPFLK
jgi:hypothetical protein